MGNHAFAGMPGQAARLQGIYPEIVNRGIFGVVEGWDMPLALWRASDGFEAHYPSNAHNTLSYIVSGAPCERLDGRFSGRRGYADLDSFMLYAGRGSRSYASRGDITLCHTYFQDSYLMGLAEAETARPADGLQLCEDRIFARDVLLRRLMDEYVARAVDLWTPPSTLEMDARAVLLGIHLLRHHSNRSASYDPHQGRLNARRLAIVLEYVEAHLSENISLATLADSVKLSPRHFCTAFKGSTGTTPHSFVTARRIERAKSLLGGTTTLADIALECGFGSQQHFTTVFRSRLGTTPGVIRAATQR